MITAELRSLSSEPQTLLPSLSARLKLLKIKPIVFWYSTSQPQLLPYKCVCVRACGCTLLNDRFNDETQLAWPTSNVGFFHYRIFLPFHLHPAAFLLRIPLEACFFGHPVDTPRTGCKFLHPFCGLFISLCL